MILKLFKYKSLPSREKFLIIVLTILFIDQSLKLLAAKKIFSDIGFIELHKNYGGLFGVSLDFNLIFPVALLLAIAVIFYQKNERLKNENAVWTIAIGFMGGGIISNLLDRLSYGYIIDYFNLLNLLSFNTADLAIGAGTLMLGYKIIMLK